MLSEIIKKNRQLIEEKSNNIDIIVDKLYLSSPTYSFINTDDSTYMILNEISNYFSIPFKHIYITGSAHIGFSLKTSSEFNPRTSDLDISIVDTYLFEKILNKISNENACFYKQDGFKNPRDFKSYITNTANGIIHPRYFPFGETKNNWDEFFQKLTIKHSSKYNKITACLFLSENSFKNKQKRSISYFRANERHMREQGK